jgi:hypothetical protein
LVLSHFPHDEEENDVGLFLLMSHLSHDDARPVVVLLLFLPSEEVLHASHLSTASARLGFGGEGAGAGIMISAAAQEGVGSSGNIFDPGGVGSSPGMAACAMARCTRATVTAMDGGWIEGAALRVREEIPLYSYTNTSEEAEIWSRGDGMRLMAHAVLYLKDRASPTTHPIRSSDSVSIPRPLSESNSRRHWNSEAAAAVDQPTPPPPSLSSPIRFVSSDTSSPMACVVPPKMTTPTERAPPDSAAEQDAAAAPDAAVPPPPPPHVAPEARPRRRRREVGRAQDQQACPERDIVFLVEHEQQQ